MIEPLGSGGAPAPGAATGPAPVVPTAHPILGEWLYAKIYSSAHLHDEILAERLPGLIRELGGAVDGWFFIRYADPEPHLRVRLRGRPRELRTAALPLLADWAGELSRLGLAGEWELHRYRPETDRYGGGEVLEEAEAVFHSDSEVALLQLSLARGKSLNADRPLITGLNLVAMVRGMLPRDWADWLLRTIPRDSCREAFLNRKSDLRGLLELDGDALAEHCGGGALAAAWQARGRELDRYAVALKGQSSGHPPGEPLRWALTSLMHMHHNRAVGIDRESEGAAHALARGFAELTVAATGVGHR